MPLRVSTLHLDGLVLRPPGTADIEAITDAVQDPEIPRYTLVPTPYTTADAAAWVDRSAASWRDGSAASFIIVDPATEALLGSIGLRLSVGRDHAEVGYWLAAGARGRGIATRALRLISRWGLDDVGLRRVDLVTDPENERSQRVAARAGFVRHGVRAFADHPSGHHELVAFSRPAGACEPGGAQR